MMSKVVRERAAAIALVAILPAVLESCCIPPPLAEKFFDRAAPVHTLKGFVYAVDAHQWDYAYESLTEASRREVIKSKFQFQAALLYLSIDVEGPGGPVRVPFFDLVSNSLRWLRDTAAVDEGPGRKRLTIITQARSKNSRLDLEVHLHFIEEEPNVWRLDLPESMRAIQARAPEVPRDESGVASASS